MFKFDFSVDSANERAALLKNFFIQNPTYTPTANEIEAMSNYLLYGKDETGTSPIERKEIDVKTKYSSYAKRQIESLDALMEQPGFNENTIVKKNVYKKKKMEIDREKDADIPGMQQLWKAIDDMAAKLAELESAPTEENRNERYHMGHLLIDLRKQQYVLKDSYKPAEHTYNLNVQKNLYASEPLDIDWNCVYFYPLGLKQKVGKWYDRFDNPRGTCATTSPWDKVRDLAAIQQENVIDFTNSEHVYTLIQMYQDLLTNAAIDIEGLSREIIDTLDFYVRFADLDEAKQVILNGKINGQSNAIIGGKLWSQFGVKHSLNYISTIYKKNICTEIAAAARLHYDMFLNRDEVSAWKVCRQCGQAKLRDNREFMRKSKASDGFASRCKKCEKAHRQNGGK